MLSGETSTPIVDYSIPQAESITMVCLPWPAAMLMELALHPTLICFSTMRMMVVPENNSNEVDNLLILHV
jgi:hypothetical protein